MRWSHARERGSGLKHQPWMRCAAADDASWGSGTFLFNPYGSCPLASRSSLSSRSSRRKTPHTRWRGFCPRDKAWKTIAVSNIPLKVLYTHHAVHLAQTLRWYNWSWCVVSRGVTESSPSLIQVYKEHHVISEAGEAMRRRHGDDEGKDIINEGIESLTERGWKKPQNCFENQEVSLDETLTMNIAFTGIELECSVLRYAFVWSHLVHECLPWKMSYWFHLRKI